MMNIFKKRTRFDLLAAEFERELKYNNYQIFYDTSNSEDGWDWAHSIDWHYFCHTHIIPKEMTASEALLTMKDAQAWYDNFTETDPDEIENNPHFFESEGFPIDAFNKKWYKNTRKEIEALEVSGNEEALKNLTAVLVQYVVDALMLFIYARWPYIMHGSPECDHPTRITICVTPHSISIVERDLIFE